MGDTEGNLAHAHRPRRALLFVNPGARRGGEALDAATDRLAAAGIEIDIEKSGSAEEIEQRLRAHPDIDVAVICGGDGSLCRAAAGLVATGTPLGILPMGTANDLARTLGIPDDLEAAAAVIADGHRRRIDVGSVNDHFFFNVASIGLSVDLAHSLDAGLKRRWGRLGYAIAAMRALLRARRFSAWITEEGRTWRTRTMQIAVGNGRFYGGGTVVASHAEIDDGHLDLYSLEFHTVWQLALMLRSFRSGEHGAWSEVATARGTEFEIRTRRPRSVNADGEIVAETPAVFRVHPGAITVYAPLDGEGAEG